MTTRATQLILHGPSQTAADPKPALAVETLRYQMCFPAFVPEHGCHRMLDWTARQTPKDVAPYEVVFDGEIPNRRGFLELIWRRHNIGDAGLENEKGGGRPRAREIRSMCIGDIVRVYYPGRREPDDYLVAFTGFVFLEPADRPEYSQNDGSVNRGGR